MIDEARTWEWATDAKAHLVCLDMMKGRGCQLSGYWRTGWKRRDGVEVTRPNGNRPDLMGSAGTTERRITAYCVIVATVWSLALAQWPMKERKKRWRRV